MNKLCRICLCTGKELAELSDNLLSYFQNICDFTSGFSEHMCCANCKDSLKDNLDFRNKCLKSNEILLEWNKNQNTTLESLHNILQETLKKTKMKKKRNTNIKYEFCDIKNDMEMKEVIIKDEMNTEISNRENVYNKNNATINNRIVDSESIDAVKIDDDDVSMDNDSSVDDKVKLTKCKKVKHKSAKKHNKRVYARKALSEYLEYEEVFDIQLFNTDEEARQELEARRAREPYLSAEFRCELCHTVYKCRKLLQFHMKWHDGCGEHVCDVCRMRFTARRALQSHKAKCHRGRFACKLCPLITYYGSAMKAHFQKHKGKTYKCHCERVFKHISSYLSHKRTVHASSHVCVTCARTFVSELGLLGHRMRVHQTKSLVDVAGTARCEPCGLTFSSQQVYNVHVLNTTAHSELARHIIGCSYCGLLFEDVAQLKSHKRLKHPRKEDTNDIIKCKLCGASGVGRSWRRRHYSSAHPRLDYLDAVGDAGVHMCDKCGKRFTNITLMKDHVNAHLGIKPYACGRCRATFSNNAARHAHVARHLTHDTKTSDKRRRRVTSETTEITSQ